MELRLIGFTCEECYFDDECEGNCQGNKNIKEVGFYKCHKDQIESLIEAAEKKWRDDGGLVVCDHAKCCIDGNEKCECSKPHIYDDDMSSRLRTTQCAYECPVHNESKCIAYNPEPKEEPEEVREYVVLKKFDTISISKTKIDSEIFKDICASISGTFYLSKDFIIKESHKLYKYAPEFERLGFVSEKVYDPVVKLNDTFQRSDGKIFMVLSAGSKGTAFSSLEGSTVYFSKEMFCVGDRLSKFMEKEYLKDFKPIKIEIKIVEGD